MNKQKAKKLACANTLSVGELRELLDAAPTYAMSRVNTALPLPVAIGIYRDALAGRADDDVPDGMCWSAMYQCDMPSQDSMLITNILRDCMP